MTLEKARRDAKEAREEMEVAIRNYADALWNLQDVLSDGEVSGDIVVLGDMVVVAHFTPTDRTVLDNHGDVVSSPQYLVLTPRNMAPHTVEGLLSNGMRQLDEERDIVLGQMYPEDGDDDE